MPRGHFEECCVRGADCRGCETATRQFTANAVGATPAAFRVFPIFYAVSPRCRVGPKLSVSRKRIRGPSVALWVAFGPRVRCEKLSDSRAGGWGRVNATVAFGPRLRLRKVTCSRAPAMWSRKVVGLRAQCRHGEVRLAVTRPLNHALRRGIAEPILLRHARGWAGCCWAPCRGI